MKDLDPIERHLFLEGIFKKYGHDFRQYAKASMDRRLSNILEEAKFDNLLDLLKKILSDDNYFQRILPNLTIGTTEFFRDIDFYKSLKKNVFPVLRTYPSVKIWIAGCSTGEELISVCVLLKESQLLERSTIYATDINPEALRRAQKAIFESSQIKQFVSSYNQVSGATSPSSYYSVNYGLAQFDKNLIKNVIFMEHSLTNDDVFDEDHLILCRNVLIYFNKELQDRVFRLFTASLTNQGFLGIGTKESLRLSAVSRLYEGVDEKLNIFQKKPSYQVGYYHEVNNEN